MRYRRLVENIDDAIWATDRAGRLDYVNPRLAELLGGAAAALDAGSLSGLVDPGDVTELEQAIAAALAGEARRFELGVSCGDGRHRVLAVTTAPVFEDGVVCGTVSVGREIARRTVGAAAALRNNHLLERLGAIGHANAPVEERVERALREVMAAAPSLLDQEDTRLQELLRNVARRMTGMVEGHRDALSSQERYALVDLGARDGLWDWDLQTQHLHYSGSWRRMLGLGEGAVDADPEAWFSRVHPEDLASLQRAILDYLQGETPHLETEHRMRHGDGTYRWVLTRGVAIWNEDGIATRMAGSQTDITESKATERRLAQGAHYDALTGLPNRALFTELLTRRMKRAAQIPDGPRYAVLFADLDQFKLVNDSLGHAAGDDLLRCVARRLQAELRGGDVAARFGGVDFAILLETVRDRDDPVRVAKRLRDELGRPTEIAGQEVFPSVSIGIAVGSAGCDGAECLLRDAHTAVQRAKAAGRARIEVFDDSMHDQAYDQMRLEQDLRRAIERAELELYYQPIVDLGSGRIATVEALLRWNHPQRGLVAPGGFVPLAEETGLIVPLGDWVLHTACAQIGSWRAAGHHALSVAVNVSARQFFERDLHADVCEALAATGVAANALQIELTESTFIRDREACISTMRALSNSGVSVVLDDFGTGYSSLNHLARLPLHELKIDKSFVQESTTKRSFAKINAALISLAHAIGLGVTAEGVEQPEQLEQLSAAGCDRVQGYLLSRPQPAAAITKLLERPGRWVH